MLEFITDRNAWRLDVVSILAILGENNIKFNSLLINLSRACLLPRLLPAPQGLLSERIKQLPYEEDIKVYRISSSSSKDGLNYFPNLLHGSGLNHPPYTVRELKLRSNPNAKTSEFRLKPFGMLNLIAMLSSLASAGLLVCAILLKDGAATVGILLMSMAAPLLYIGTKWKLSLPYRGRANRSEPADDVVFRSREGTITVVRFTASIARSLYFAPELILYATRAT